MGSNVCRMRVCICVNEYVVEKHKLVHELNIDVYKVWIRVKWCINVFGPKYDKMGISNQMNVYMYAYVFTKYVKSMT